MISQYSTLQDYCKAINIPPPKRDDFDIRSFQENMPSVVHKMPPFKHEFYAIALKLEGSGKAISGHHESLEGSTVFFNSPFQIISWDIAPDWEGYYIIFTKDFIAKSKHLLHLLDEFSFLKIDKAIPFAVDAKEALPILSVFQNIYEELQNEKADSLLMLEAQVLLLLNYVKRYFNLKVDSNEASKAIRKTDVKLLSRFQTLIETQLRSDAPLGKGKTHSPSYYANQLGIHPNHLNTIVKSITQHTAKQHVHEHLLRLAKSRLLQTDMSVKEIAYSLHFDSPNNFSSFFKKYTGKTPNSFRKEAIL
ncbi:helix-turn-helix domain-containing protein [Flagellimonas onchidii]|uniref:helix-turn-helix domain-containing protein n=1 Tax=Flagellimonas onchidii TaxID=2562684 RepID=UPI00197A9582|nr:helix-turn-helix domain-containing protein [Allomuricauda onchidii]